MSGHFFEVTWPLGFHISSMRQTSVVFRHLCAKFLRSAYPEDRTSIMLLRSVYASKVSSNLTSLTQLINVLELFLITNCLLVLMSTFDSVAVLRFFRDMDSLLPISTITPGGLLKRNHSRCMWNYDCHKNCCSTVCITTIRNTL